MNNITCIFRSCSGSLFQRQLHCLPKHWSKRAFTAGQSVFVQAQHQQASNPVQPNVTTAKSEGNVDGSAFQRLQKLQSRQKLLLEEPEETEPHVVYTGGLTRQMKSLKLLSFSTSAMGLVMVPLLYQETNVPMAGIVAGGVLAGFFTFGTPILIHLLAKKYVTEIVYDPGSDTYKATTFTFFLQKKEMSFKADDVVVPEVPGPFTTLTVKTKDEKVIPYFIAPESFVKPSHYGKLMGYDKPIDFRLTINKVAGISEKKSGGLSSR